MTETTTANSKTNNRTPNRLQRFFMVCSGSDRSVLDQCPTEWNKYSGIGATIFFTGFLGALSGGYALYSIFRGDTFAFLYALIFGIVWGLLIFNLDRFIVSSIRKEGKIKKELFNATPRFILAIIISVVIAKPLEVRLFESRIEQQILEDKRKKLTQEKTEIEQLNDLSILENKINTQNQELNNLDNVRKNDPTDISFIQLIEDRNRAQNVLIQTKTQNNTKISDYNRKIRSIRASSDNYSISKDSLGNIISKTLFPKYQNEIQTQFRNIRNLRKEIEAKTKALSDIDIDIKNAREYHYEYMTRQINQKKDEIGHTQQIKSNADSIAQAQFKESLTVKERSYTNNFITQLEAMGNLTESNNTMKYTSWMIMLLFIVVETAPIVVKLMSKRGPYDAILEGIEHDHHIRERDAYLEKKSTAIAKHNVLEDTLNKQNEVQMQIEQMQIKQELKNNEKIISLIGKKQEDLSNIKIEKWYQDELKEISSSGKAIFINKFWKHKGVEPSTEYLFINGAVNDNRLLLIRDNEMQTGKWNYNDDEDELSLDVNDKTHHYTITDITNKSMILEEKETKEIIVLQIALKDDTQT